MCLWWGWGIHVCIHVLQMREALTGKGDPFFVSKMLIVTERYSSLNSELHEEDFEKRKKK